VFRASPTAQGFVVVTPEPDVVERPVKTCWLSGPPVTVVVVTVVVVWLPDVLDGGDVVTGLVVTDVVVTGVVATGAGTGIGWMGSDRGVLTGVVVVPDEEDWPDEELLPLELDPDWSWPFASLRPGVALWLSGVPDTVCVLPVPSCVFGVGPAVAPDVCGAAGAGPAGWAGCSGAGWAGWSPDGCAAVGVEVCASVGAAVPSTTAVGPNGAPTASPNEP
jgi:hypothetical protein